MPIPGKIYIYTSFYVLHIEDQWGNVTFYTNAKWTQNGFGSLKTQETGADGTKNNKGELVNNNTQDVKLFKCNGCKAVMLSKSPCYPLCHEQLTEYFSTRGE